MHVREPVAALEHRRAARAGLPPAMRELVDVAVGELAEQRHGARSSSCSACTASHSSRATSKVRFDLERHTR